MDTSILKTLVHLELPQNSVEQNSLKDYKRKAANLGHLDTTTLVHLELPQNSVEQNSLQDYKRKVGNLGHIDTHRTRTSRTFPKVGQAEFQYNTTNPKYEI